MSGIKISFIIPCYNCVNTLSRTVDSILAQSCSDYEIVLVNDGSKDGTLNLINNLISKYPKIIKLIDQTNQGVSSARNAGLKIARGEYILFIDSDDTIHQDFAKALLNIVESQAVDTAFAYISRDKTAVNNAQGRKTTLKNEFILSQEAAMRIFMLEKANLGFTSFIYRKEVLEKYNIIFPVGLKTGEDVEFIWHYLARCQTIAVLPQYMYWYCDNAVSAVHNVAWNRTDSYASIQRIYKYLQECNVAFADEFFNFYSARYIWSYAKTFSIAKRFDLVKKLAKEYDIKHAMKYLIGHCSDKRVRATAIIYLISPRLFFRVIQLFSGVKE